MDDDHLLAAMEIQYLAIEEIYNETHTLPSREEVSDRIEKMLDRTQHKHITMVH